MQGQQGFTIWFTGMAGAGKRTLAAYVAPRLQMIGRKVELLGGDELREGLLGGGTVVQPGAGFEAEGRRLGLLCKLLTRNGVVAIATSISPLRDAREEARRDIGRFVEVFVDCRIETLFERDVEGFYSRGTQGTLEVPGHNAPYDVPSSPDVVVKTDQEKVEESAARIFGRLREMGYVTREEHEVLAGGIEAPAFEIAEIGPPPEPEEAPAPPPARAAARAAPPAPKAAAGKAANPPATAPEKAAKAPAGKPSKAAKAPPEKPAKAPAPKAEKAPPAKAEKAPPVKAGKAPAAKPAKAEKPAARAKAAAPPAKPAKAPPKAAAKAPAKAAKVPARDASKAKAAPRRAAAKVAKPAPAKAAKGRARR